MVEAGAGEAQEEAEALAAEEEVEVLGGEEEEVAEAGGALETVKVAVEEGEGEDLTEILVAAEADLAEEAVVVVLETVVAAEEVAALKNGRLCQVTKL